MIRNACCCFASVVVKWISARRSMRPATDSSNSLEEETASHSLVTTISLTEGSLPSRLAPRPLAEAMPRLAPICTEPSVIQCV
jgi:hypothetical protein